MTITSQYKQAAGARRNFTVEEAAEYLRISERFLRELIATRRIPHIRIGRRIIFRESVLDSWMEENACE